jgi:hypothetical protein
VLTALTGKEGIAIFRDEPIDMVSLDYWMAGMDGLAQAKLEESIAKRPSSSPRDMRLSLYGLPLMYRQAWVGDYNVPAPESRPS